MPLLGCGYRLIGVNFVLCCWQLFASCEAHAQGKGAALAPGKGAEVGSVPIVHHGIGILAAKDVHGFHARGPEVAAIPEFLFDSKIETGIGGKARRIRRAHELLLEVDDAEGIACAVFEKPAQLDAPDVRGGPAPGKQAVGGIPGHGACLLRSVEDGTERGIQDLVGARDGTRVGSEEFGPLRENVARGNSGGAVTIPAVIPQKKNSAGLRRLLIDESETVIAIAGEELEADERVVRERLLPGGAGNGETRLVKPRRKNELARDGAEDDDRSRGIVKGIELRWSRTWLITERLREAL